MSGSSQVMNLFGFQVDGMDVEAFLPLPRLTFVVLALIGAAIMARGGGEGLRTRVVLALAAIGHLLAWFATMFPLPNVYGANGSMDRENHLGWANVVASGFSPLYTSQVNHLHFEPLWPFLAGLASGFNPDRVYAFFLWTPLIMGLALLWSVHTAWSRIGEELPGLGTGAAFAAIGALLLMAVPGDFSGPFRNPWALTFLLKPNHALGLVLVPLALLAIARANSWKSRLYAGFILQLVGWAFVIHMVLVVAGLTVFIALAWLERRRDRATDLLDVGTAVGVNLLIVSPYLFMLVVAYPFLEGNVPNTLPPLSERPIEAPLRMGALFLVGAFGAWNAHRGGNRLARMFASQWLAAQLIWQLFPLLGLIGQSREQDEAFYWCRFWSGLFAGFGIWRLSHLILARLRIGALSSGERLQGAAATLSLLLLLPSLVPSWWDPKPMDQYFVAAREPLPDWVAEPTRFIRTHTPREAVFAGDRNYARWVGAYGARRVLLSNALNAPNDHVRRKEVERALLRNGPEILRVEGRDRYSIQYLLVTSRPLEQDPELTLDQLQSLPYLETVYDRDFPSARVVILKVLSVGHDRQ